MKTPEKPRPVKTDKIVIRVTPQRREQIAREALKAQLTVAEWARRVVDERLPPGDSSGKTE